MTAGSGIQHAEMFPLLDRDGPNTAELFQIWINLPAADKMVEPHFTMLWDHDIPRHVVTDADGRTAEITVIAGELAGHVPPPPPPHSWASRPEADVALWHVVLEPGARGRCRRRTSDDTVRVLYVFDGSGSRSTVTRGEGTTGAVSTGVVVDPSSSRPHGTAHVELLVMQGRPIGEPVAQEGPFVMNTRAEIARGVRRLPPHPVRRLAVGPTTRRTVPHRPVRPSRRRPGRRSRRRLRPPPVRRRLRIRRQSPMRYGCAARAWTSRGDDP